MTQPLTHSFAPPSHEEWSCVEFPNTLPHRVILDSREYESMKEILLLLRGYLAFSRTDDRIREMISAIFKHDAQVARCIIDREEREKNVNNPT